MALTIDELNIQIEAESKKATSAIDALVDKFQKLQNVLGPLASTNIKISNSFNTTTKTIEKASNATDKHKNSTDKAGKSAKSYTDKLAQQISKTRTLYGAFETLAKKMAGLFNESNEYIETLNLFKVTMGEGADAAYEYAESVQNLIGIDLGEWMQYQGVFKNLTAGFGVASKDANIMSQNLTQLSYDMASFFNTDVETAFDKLSSAMSGQVKGLREFGVDTTVASLQEYALAKGIDTKVRSMTQAEKSMLRYNYIMEKSIIMQGDMARTLVTPANALRVLNAQLTQMKRAFGNVISVIITQFIPYIQVMVEAVTDAANALAKFLGFELPKIDYSGLGDGGAFEDDEEALKGMSGSLKKIKKQLMGFDELNIISNPDSDSGAAGGGSASGSLNGMKPIEYDFLKNIDTSAFDKVAKKLKDIWKTLKPIATLVAGIFAVAIITKWAGAVSNAFQLINAKMYASTIGFAIQAWIGGAATFGESLAYISQSMSTLQKVALGVGTAVAEFLVIFTLVRDLTYDVNNGSATTGQIITTIIAGIAALGVAWVAFYTVFMATGIGAIIATIATAVVALVAGIAGFVSGVQEAGKAAYESTEDFKIMSTVIEDAAERTERCDEAIKSMTESVSELDRVSYDYAIAKNLTNEIFELNEKATLSNYELAQIKQKVEVLNGLNIDGLQLTIDETTGRVIQTRKETEALIEVLKKEAQMEALRDIMVESYRNQYQAQVDVKNAQNDLVTASQALKKSQDELEGTAWWDFGKRAELKAAIDKEREAVAEAHRSYEKANETMELAGKNIAFASEEYNKLAGAQETFVKATDEANKSLEVAATDSYKNAANIVNGATKGITDNAGAFTNSVSGMANDGNNAFAKAIDSHSPAKKYVEFAGNIVQGLVNGVNGSKNKAIETIKVLAQEMNKAFSDTVNSTFGKNVTLTTALDKILENAKKAFSKTTWEGYAKNVTNSLAAIKTPSLKNLGLSVWFDTNVSSDKKKVYDALGLSGWPKLNWYTYAQGGFPDVGEMFIAREAGPELVGSIGRKTAVANNDQIISGIESGVYRAMVAANAGANGGTQTIRIINEIDGDVVGEKVIKYHNGKVMQTGVSPLMV